jgi:hypothetical protein
LRNGICLSTQVNAAVTLSTLVELPIWKNSSVRPLLGKEPSASKRCCTTILQSYLLSWSSR